MRTLRIGSEGHDVRILENFLTGRGIDVGEVDARFTTQTHMGVRQWQDAAHLKEDGVVGRDTWASLLAAGIDLVLDPEQEWPPPPDNLVALISNDLRMRKWGRFEWVDAPEPRNREAIRILGDWEAKNIRRVTCPVLRQDVRLHHAVVDDYIALMHAILKEGLQHLILTNDGAFVARYIRGSTRTLSNHAWGTAFDRNAAWNGLGMTPAYRGQKGSLREIVPLANQHNWYWGGHFRKRSRRDGMHFEHV